ncbi:hypothetical protein [Burkholderia stagnalis]
MEAKVFEMRMPEALVDQAEVFRSASAASNSLSCTHDDQDHIKHGAFRIVYEFPLVR